MPLPAPVTDQLESDTGPLSVSVPPPPSRLTARASPTIDASTVKLSSPLPPVTERLETEASAFDCATPSTVTTRFVPSTATETVCAEPSERVRAHGAGGERPLLVFAFGSIRKLTTPGRRGRRAVGLRQRHRPTSVPPEPPEPLPVGSAPHPSVEPAPGPSPDCPDGDDVEDCVPVGSVALVVSGAVNEVDPVASVPVDAVIVTVVVSAGRRTRTWCPKR